MSFGTAQTDAAPSGPAEFASTHWSLVLAAGSGGEPRSRAALAELCRVYWRPLYAFVRRQGFAVHDAEDLTQEFFRLLLEKNYLSAVNRDRGRFRSFLLAALQHFLANQWDKLKAQKRGGGQPVVPLDTQLIEASLAPGLADSLSPEKLYDRRWALTLLERVLARLEEEHRAAPGEMAFRELKHYLTGDERGRPYADAAKALGTTEGAVKVAVHRLRQRCRQILREEVASTLADPRQVDDELQALFAAFNP